MHFIKNGFFKQQTVTDILELVTNKTKCRPKSYRKGYMVCCPAHDDKKPSLSVFESNDRITCFKCFRGCSTEEICASLGISVKSLFPQRSKGYRYGR